MLKRFLAVLLTFSALLVVAASASAQTTGFTDTYKSYEWNVGCTGAASNGVYGREPTEGTNPVLIYTHGMWGIHNGAEAKKIVDRAAELGFVAVAADWNSWSFYLPDSLWPANARCIYGQDSLLTQVCARPRADCSKGVAVWGHSKGSMIAMRARDHHPTVATLLMGYAYDSGVRNRSDVLVINGEIEANRGSLALRTGMSCLSTAFECTRADGTGWRIVPHTEVSDGNADHCYYQIGGCSWGSKFEPAWLGSQPWSLDPSLLWLKQRAAAP